MTTHTPNPTTILFVPGSFSSQGIYQPIITSLRQRNHPALALTLPSTQKRYPLPPASMPDDAAHIRSVAEALIAQGKDVVVVCHSYGGTPTSQGLVGLGKKKNEGGGGGGAAGAGVKKIVYLTAVVPRVGESQVEAMNVPAGLVESAVDGYMHLSAPQMAGSLGNDLPSWEEAYDRALLFPHHSVVSFTAPVTQVAYAEIPCSYILCERDLIIDVPTQRRFIGVLEEEGGSGGKVRVVSLDAGHCPHWSVLEELVEAILEVAGEEEE